VIQSLVKRQDNKENKTLGGSSLLVVPPIHHDACTVISKYLRDVESIHLVKGSYAYSEATEI
jgi:hypothetical protein